VVDVESGVRDDAGGVGRRGEEETEVFANVAGCADRADRATALALGVTDAGSRMVDEVRAVAAGLSTWSGGGGGGGKV
jgi:hypothetical protein